MDKTKLPCRSISLQQNLLQELWEDGVTSQIAVQHMITFDANKDAGEPVLTTYKKSVDPIKFGLICTKYGLNPLSIDQINEFEYREITAGPAYKHVHVYPDDGPYNPISEDNDVVVVCIVRQTGGLKEKTSGPVLD